ncbi:MAG: phosphate signaling complex protein PhoU [bacterium]|nr:phosphate signaling complex protein PhoU [bacterium]
MQRHFDEELADLGKEVLRMGSLTEESILKSVEALKARSAEQARQVITEDKKIDEMELAIDEKCLDLLALHQPMAIDLRFITMTMKICTDLERIADLAVDIAQRCLEISDKPQLKPLIDIPKLATLAQSMVKEAIDAFVHKDVELAKKVILRDPEADNLRNLVQSELISDYISKDASTAPRAVALLLVARHLERICDHTTNIAEDVIYMVEGKVVKHHLEALEP